MIIDDNSDFKYLTVNKKLTNCSIIYSEYNNRRIIKFILL